MKNRKLLLVEDEAIIALDTARRLEAKGYVVEQALSGEAAIARLDGSAADGLGVSLVLMDIDLGSGIDGLETARRILADRSVPIVFYTNHAEQEMVDRVREISRYGYVLKTTGDVVLVSTIETALNLFETEMELRTLYDQAPMTMMLVDRDLRVRRSGDREESRVLGEALGCVEYLTTRGGCVGCGASPLCRSCVIKSAVLSSMASGRPRRQVHARMHRRVREEDSEYHLLVSTAPMTPHTDRRVLLSILDITDQRVLESKYSRSRERFNGLAEAVPVMVWESDEHGNCVYFNDRWLEYVGRTTEQEWGDGWLEGVYHEDAPMVVERFRSALATHDPFELTYRLRGADGVYRWVLDTGVPQTGPDGTFAGFIGAASLVIDTRELKKWELHDDGNENLNR